MCQTVQQTPVRLNELLLQQVSDGAQHVVSQKHVI